MILNKSHIAIMVSSGDHFLPTFHRLTGLLCLDNALTMVKEFGQLLTAVQADGGLDPSPAFAAALSITILHMMFGTPLFFSDEMMHDWNTAGTTTGGVECSRCAFRQPSGAACIPCGGATGQPGCWAKTRAAKAGSN